MFVERLLAAARELSSTWCFFKPCMRPAASSTTVAKRGHRFRPGELDLTLAIALMNAYNRMAISFRATPTALAA